MCKIADKQYKKWAKTKNAEELIKLVGLGLLGQIGPTEKIKN